MVSKAEKEKRKEEIIEQQTSLDNQGFSIRNINVKNILSTDSILDQENRKRHLCGISSEQIAEASTGISFI